MPKSVLELHRHSDGTLAYRGELPDRHVFSAKYIHTLGRGDNGDVEPIFTRDGMDITFPFETGSVAYRFVGFEDDDAGEPNTRALVYERVVEAAAAKKRGK